MLSLLLVGCSSKHVQYLDNDDVKVTKVRLEEKGEFPIAHMYFIHKDEDVIVDTVYRIEWLNSEGETIETTSWRPVTIHGKRKIPVSERATVPGAVDFQVLISNESR